MYNSKVIGVDLTRISRFEKTSLKVVRRFLHEEEIKLLEGSKNKALFLAKRWAIKEALFKADNNLGVFRKINIRQNEQNYFYNGFAISTSVEEDHCVAFVVKEKRWN